MGLLGMYKSNGIHRPGLPSLRKNIHTLAKQVGTPFYYYDWDSIKTSLALLLSSAEKAGIVEQSQFFLAFFSLPNVEIFRRALELSPKIGINCNALEEIYALKKLGLIDWQRVVLSGGVLPERDLLEIAATGCLINVASIGNLEKLINCEKTQYIGLRLDFSGVALKGIHVEDISACIEKAERKGKKVVSLHAYPGTEIDELGLLLQHAETLIGLAAQYPQIEEINFGGGFWYNYSDTKGKLASMLDFELYFQSIQQFLKQYMPKRKIQLKWEPGRIAFAQAGFFVTKILEFRKTSINTADVYVDSSFTHLPSLKMRNRQHQIIVLDAEGQIKQGSRYSARICGCTSLSSDRVLPKACSLPEVEEGDFLVVADLGAYGRAGSYTFLGKAQPPEILYDSDQDTWEIIRKRQDLNHLFDGIILK